MNSYTINPGLRRLASVRNHLPHFMMRIVVACSAVLVNVAQAMKLITSYQEFSVITLLLLLYLFAEAKHLKERQPQLFLINPVILGTTLTFVLPFGISNAIYFLPESVLDLVGVSPVITQWMNQLMMLVLLGAIFMWVGYTSGLGRKMGLMLKRSRFLRKWMKPSFKVNMTAVYVCVSISLIAKLLLIKLGLYGYSSSYDRIIEGAAYTQYFTLASSLGQFAMLGLAMQCFSVRRAANFDLLLLCFITCLEVVFGFISGFKSQVAMPFLILGLVYYSQHNKFPLWLAPAVMVSVMAAYAVIEPFRDARNNDPGFVGTSLISIVKTMINAPKIVSSNTGEDNSASIELLARTNMTQIGSFGIEYAAKTSQLPANSPAFLGNIFLAPVHALIPRFLWSSKPLETIGLWYTQEVIGLNMNSSTGMTAFTYLNFAGGPLAVCLGFWFVGVAQRASFDGLRSFGGGGLIVLFGILNTLANIDSSFNGFFVNLVRLPLILVVAQYALLRGVRR